MAPLRSLAWDHFEDRGDFKAECKRCKVIISYRTTVSNLIKHLQRKHISVNLVRRTHGVEHEVHAAQTTRVITSTAAASVTSNAIRSNPANMTWTNATENWQGLASPMIIVENGCVKSPARWNEDEDRKESVEALYSPQPSLFAAKLSPHSTVSLDNTPLTSPLSFEAPDADVKDENIVNDISSAPDWVLQIEERRLAVEERTARAFEAIATGLAGIQATLEAMRQDAR